VNISGSEFEILKAEIGDDVDVADTKEVTHTIIDSKDADRFLIIAPRQFMQAVLTYRANRDLFSNYYLDEHLPETEAWDEISDDELRVVKENIMELWERERKTASKRNESQLKGHQDAEAGVHRERHDRQAGEDAEQHHRRDEPALPGHHAVEPHRQYPAMTVTNPNAPPMRMNRRRSQRVLPLLPRPDHDPPLGIH